MSKSNRSIEAEKHRSLITGITTYLMHVFYQDNLLSVNDTYIDFISDLEAQMASFDDNVKDLLNSFNSNYDAFDSFVISGEWLCLHGFADKRDMMRSMMLLEFLIPGDVARLTNFAQKTNLLPEDFQELLREANINSDFYFHQIRHCNFAHNYPSFAKAFYLKINQKSCTGCEACIGVCLKNAIVMKNNKLCVTKDCVGCWSCIAECSFNAIELVGSSGLNISLIPENIDNNASSYLKSWEKSSLYF